MQVPFGDRELLHPVTVQRYRQHFSLHNHSILVQVPRRDAGWVPVRPALHRRAIGLCARELPHQVRLCSQCSLSVYSGMQGQLFSRHY